MADLGAFGPFQVVGRDGVIRIEAVVACDVEQHAAAGDGRHGVDAELLEADGGLDAVVDMNAAVQRQVLRLMRERIDVCARMLWHKHDAGRAGARLARPARVVAMEEVAEAGRVRRVGWCSRVAQLFEVENASRLERIEEGLRRQSL